MDTPLLRHIERFTRTDLRYLARSGFWGNLGTLSVTVFSLLLYLTFAAHLSKETFGVYQYLLSLGAILGALTFTGMNTAVTGSVARGFENTFTQAVHFQLRYVWAPIIVGLLGSVYYFLNENVVLGLGLIIVSIGVPLINAWNTYSAFLLGKKDFKRVFLYNFAINVPFYTLLIGAAYITESPLILIALNLGVQVVGYYLAYRAVRKHITPHTESETGALTYGTHLSVMGAFSTIANQIDAVLAFHFLGAGGLAVYAFATAIPERLGGFFKFLPGAALPKFANRTAEEVRVTIGRRLLIAIPWILIAAGIYALCAPLLFSFLFPAYLESVPYSQWYGLALGGVLTQVLVSALQAHARVRRLYVFSFLSPFLQCVLQLLGVLFFDLWGLVVGRLLGLLVSFVLALALVLIAPPKEASLP